MKDISQLKTLASLLTKDGKLNAAIIRQAWFKTTPIYVKILEKSTCLDIFEHMSFAARFWFLQNKMKIQHCKKCNAAYIDFPKLQQSYHLCDHCQKFNTKALITNRRNSYAENLAQLVKNVEHGVLCLHNKAFSKQFAEITSKSKNFQFMISKSYIDFYSDVILKTKSLIVFDSTDLKLPERLYALQHKLSSIPKCKFCNNTNAEFINRVQGYSQTCKSDSCRHMQTLEKLNEQYEKSAESYRKTIDSLVDSSKYEILQYPKILSREPLSIRCKKCNAVSDFYLVNGRLNHMTEASLYCRQCESRTSSLEREISQFIVDECNCSQQELVRNDRELIKPLELDIYVPSKHIAIEADGLYWHSAVDSSCDYNRHVNKTNLCEQQHIQLIHIFENEWHQKQDIVKSRLKNLFGLFERTVFARKCTVKELSSKECRSFLNENHIQGAVNASVNLGLFFDDELVSLMTFGRTRFSKKYEWEMLRFCNKLGHHVPGAASRLLKHFEKTYQPKSILSYADRRWSQGKLYNALGFKLDHASKPDYWYWKNDMLESRLKYQKHRLKGLLEKFDESLSEVQNMLANGYNRIFDCGNLVFVKEYCK